MATLLTMSRISLSALPDLAASAVPFSTMCNSMFHCFDSFFCFVLNGLDHLADLAGSPGGAFGQGAHLVGTTAKPRPCSPARAASMAAFKASRFVWSAISSIVPMISPIWSLRVPRLSTVLADCRHCRRWCPMTDTVFPRLQSRFAQIWRRSVRLLQPAGSCGQCLGCG